MTFPNLDIPVIYSHYSASYMILQQATMMKKWQYASYDIMKPIPPFSIYFPSYISMQVVRFALWYQNASFVTPPD